MTENNQENNNTDPEQGGGSNVGVAVIKYGTTLIIFFAILWFIINYVLPLF